MKMKEGMDYTGCNVKLGKYSRKSTPKGTAVNGSFEKPDALAGSHRKTFGVSRYKGHHLNRGK